MFYSVTHLLSPLYRHHITGQPYTGSTVCLNVVQKVLTAWAASSSSARRPLCLTTETELPKWLGTERNHTAAIIQHAARFLHSVEACLLMQMQAPQTAFGMISRFFHGIVDRVLAQ